MVFEMDSSLIVKLGNRKRLFVTPTETDSLSKLPDNMVDYILERLPIQDAVRTSILSRNWRYRWTKISSIVLDEQFSNKLTKNGALGYNGFIRVTNQLFHFLTGPILKVHLYIPNMILDSFQEINQLILSLSRDRVIRELTLINSNQIYQIPSYLFHCSQLRRLKLKNCIFKPPLEFRGFFSLSNLWLANITFGANLSGTIIELPQLKKLGLVRCSNVYNFNIMATKLQFLRVINCFDAMFLQLVLRSRRLTRVYLVTFKPIILVQIVNLAKILRKMPSLVSLTMDGCFLKFSVAENIPKWLPHTANRLARLRLINLNFNDLDQLKGALFILRNSPNLEQLSLISRLDLQSMHLDVNSALTYLADSDCFDQSLNRLKTIKIKVIAGSRPLLLFIKLLLDHSPALEVISIRLVTVDAHEKYKFDKDVMRLPRASSKAELLFLDP